MYMYIHNSILFTKTVSTTTSCYGSRDQQDIHDHNLKLSGTKLVEYPNSGKPGIKKIFLSFILYSMSNGLVLIIVVLSRVRYHPLYNIATMYWPIGKFLKCKILGW